MRWGLILFFAVGLFAVYAYETIGPLRDSENYESQNVKQESMTSAVSEKNGRKKIEKKKVNEHPSRSLIGKRSSVLYERFGRPTRRAPSAFGYEWWVYGDDWRQYRAYGIEDGKIVTMIAYGPDTSPLFYSIGQKKENVRENGQFRREWAFVYQGNHYLFRLTEGERIRRPLVRIGDVWAILYFDIHRGTLAGVRLLNKETLLKQRPYTLVYRGKLLEPPTLSAEKWRKVEEEAERQIFELTNVIRQRYGKAPLKWDEKTAKVAYLHSKEMAQEHYFSHTSPDGENLSDRLVAGGVAFAVAGENIAAKYTDAFSAVQGWVNSKGHRKNLFNEAFTHLGVGVYRQYYTQNFIKKIGF